MKSNPQVSIGMPVFNGERYIKEAIDSILAQTFSGFELIISDNASTDKTREICQDYASRDRRIRYYRNSENLGAAKNFNRVFELSTGEYFKWAAHDDVIDPNYLSKCIDGINNNPELVLCHSMVEAIDENGKELGRYETNFKNVESRYPHKRFGNLILTDQWCFEIFGLIRSSALKNTRLIASYISSDATLRAELGLLGRFHIIPEYLFFSREHPQRSIRTIQGHHQRGEWFDPANKDRIQFPHWRVFLEYIKCVYLNPLKMNERALCHVYLIRWFVSNWNWMWMVLNLIVVAVPRSWGFIWKVKQIKRRHLKSKNEFTSTFQ
jgi:glycosyltransferase involved in cell wall biosynthesis